MIPATTKTPQIIDAIDVVILDELRSIGNVVSAIYLAGCVKKLLPKSALAFDMRMRSMIRGQLVEQVTREGRLIGYRITNGGVRRRRQMASLLA